MTLDLWIEYLLRFSHLVAGIAWIGSSFYFIWLDSSFTPPESPRRNVDGELFMVHGGFYYAVEKRKIYPGEIPKVLHWFKWEATLTWITGFVLFIFLYYLRGASLLTDRRVLALSHPQAVGLSLGIFALSWLLYDAVWNPAIIRSKKLSTFLSLPLFLALVYGSTRVFSGRGAFIQVGATLGTLMLLNVWVRILPGQAKMLKDAQEGKVPDYSIGLKSKTRSVHNTYFIFPVLLIMLSNHYATFFNHPHNWLLLTLLSVSGAMVRHAMVTKDTRERWMLLPATAGLFALFAFPAAPGGSFVELSSGDGKRIEFTRVRSVLESRCLTCHGAQPTDQIFKVPPKGLVLEREEEVRAAGMKIYQQVVQAKAMPLANQTQMTDEERVIFARWLKQEGLAP